MIRATVILLSIVLILSSLPACSSEEVPKASGCSEVQGCLNEEWVVGKLLKESNAFAAFYQAERKRMPKHIHWVEDLSLPSSNPGITDLLVDITYLKRMPSSNEDDFLVAHEMATYIERCEGFPSTRPTAVAVEQGVTQLSRELNSMLSSPLRDSMLAKYGFDLEKAYKFYLGDFFSGQPHPPADKAETFKFLFLYVQIVLYWEDVMQKTEMSDFQRVFNERYPEIAKEGNTLLNKIRANGYDTPHKVAVLYEYVIDKYNLYEVIEHPYR